MSANLDDTLVRTLNAVAVSATEPAPDFYAGIAARRRRLRRTRRAGVAAVVAVCVAVAGGFAAVGLIGRPAPDATDPAVAPIDLEQARPIEQVWSEAIVKVPEHLPDGRIAIVGGRVGGDRFLIVPGTPEVSFQLPVVFNVSTGEVRELTPGAPAGYKEYSYCGAWLGERHILWSVCAVDGADRRTWEVWSAPRAGGDSVRRAVLVPQTHDHGVHATDIDGELYLVLSREEDDAVYQIRDDGVLRQVADGDDYGVVAPGWLRVGFPRPALPSADPSTAAGETAATLWNPRTGERRTPRLLPGLTQAHCVPESCVGRDADGYVRYRFDGTGVRRARIRPDDTVPPAGLEFDPTGRFIQLRFSPDAYLWDPSTNTAARLTGNSQILFGLIVLRTVDGTQYVLDTAAIR
jgi:hypothetical protein